MILYTELNMKKELFCVCLAFLIFNASFAEAKLCNSLHPEKIPTPSANTSTIDAADQCVPAKKCNPDAPYRSLDGSCNNLRFPMWGQTGAALSRLAPAEYVDGVSEPRKAVSGKDLPNARKIVLNAFSYDEVVDQINTLAVMSFGQLVSHDGSLINSPADQPESCCTQGGPKCMNIDVASDDPFYKQFNVTCLPFLRTVSTAELGCPLKPVYTMTEVSHFMDASFVYGSSDKSAARLRENDKGLLKETSIAGQSYPPHNSTLCFGQSPTDLCMETGDVRANQNPPLGGLQILFFREHNRLATALQKLNPSWDDEKLYQEARKILIAEYQIVVYRDWLPKIIGLEAATAKRLIPDLDLMSDDYDEFFNPSTTNDFTSAAFRVFHSQVPSAYCAKGGKDKATGCPFGANNFSNSFDNPHILSTQEGFQSVLFGLDKQNAARTDEAFSEEISGKLFRHGKPRGHDLISTDIARGRDTGLPPYNAYRSLCGMSPATSWIQLLDVFTLQDLQKLRSVYESPEDIDLYVAGTMEKKFPGALVGPTFQCIIVDQFKRWMKGDRYFVDFKGFKHSFNPEQAKALKGTSLARIFCDNGGEVKDMPRDVFLLQSERVSCDQLPRVDLSPWQESKLVNSA